MSINKKEALKDAIVVTFMTACVVLLISSVVPSEKNTAQASRDPSTTSKTVEPIVEPVATEKAEASQPVTLYDVPLDKELQLHIIKEAEAHDIEPSIIMAMAYKESGFNADAVGDGGKSFGLLQIQKRYHLERMERLGCSDLLDPHQNVTVAVDYLCELLNRYDGNYGVALTAYNKGHYAGSVTQYARIVIAKAEEVRCETYESP